MNDSDSIDELHPRLKQTLVQHDNLIDELDPRAGGRSHQSFIFSGPKGIGKATAAYTLARRLFSNTSEEAGLFGDAPSPSADDPQARLVAANSHPDLLTLEPDPTKASQTITVEQVRKISHFLSHSPKMGEWRMVIVDSLDAVNFNGANAMLKTLEEPPAHSLIVLINHQTRPVLPTIRSRCRMVRFSPLDFDQARALVVTSFPEADPNWIDVATVLSGGAPGKVMLFADAGTVDLYAETCSLIAEDNAKPAAIETLASQWGAGGGANIARRQSARLVFDRLITMAVRKSAGAGEMHQGATLDIENRATDRIASLMDAEKLALTHQDLIRNLDEAEGLNTDQSVIFFNLIHGFAVSK